MSESAREAAAVPPKVTCERGPGSCPSSGIKRCDIIFVEERDIIGECFSRCVSELNYDVSVARSVSACIPLAKSLETGIFIICATNTQAMCSNITEILSSCTGFQVMVLGCSSDDQLALKAIGSGASAFLPANTNLSVLIGVIALVLSGGIYLPADISLSLSENFRSSCSLEKFSGEAGMVANFTAKQHAIIDAIRVGKPNKVIAYEMGMCESTVKVHIRNIMKKANVRNRTELAYKATNFQSQHHQLRAS
jgi:DNA-binding NarL/FixJ family response regulator